MMSSSEDMNASSFSALMATSSFKCGPSSMHLALYTLANVPCARGEGDEASMMVAMMVVGGGGGANKVQACDWFGEL